MFEESEMTEQKKDIEQVRMVSIESGKLQKLMEDSLMLQCLINCGVDCWGAYGDARQQYKEAMDSL